MLKYLKILNIFEIKNPIIHHRVFSVVSWGLTILISLHFVNNIFNFVKINPIYLYILQQILLTYVCMFMIIRFNPWRKDIQSKSVEVSKFEAEVVFHASFLLVLTTAVIKFTEKFLQKQEDQLVDEIKKN